METIRLKLSNLKDIVKDLSKNDNEQLLFSRFLIQLKNLESLLACTEIDAENKGYPDLVVELFRLTGIDFLVPSNSISMPISIQEFCPKALILLENIENEMHSQEERRISRERRDSRKKSMKEINEKRKMKNLTKKQVG
jgi:hypothetical protein